MFRSDSLTSSSSDYQDGGEEGDMAGQGEVESMGDRGAGTGWMSENNGEMGEQRTGLGPSLVSRVRASFRKKSGEHEGDRAEIVLLAERSNTRMTMV